MSNGLDTRPTATTLELYALVRRAWDGEIRVPYFQRSFRWSARDVLRLFDSIYKGYPIGSLLLWERKAPAQHVQLGALHLEAPKLERALWVVDGQQRITSLASALHDDGSNDRRFALSFDLRNRAFVARPPIEDPLIIPLPILADLQRVLRWFADHPEVSDYIDTANEATTRLRQYPVPVYQVSQEDEHVLQDIFDRLNNYGKRLSRSEIFAALNASENPEEQEDLSLAAIASHIDSDYGFGTLDDDTVLLAVLGRRDPDVRRDIRNEFSNPYDEGRVKAYQAAEDSIRQSVSFLQRIAHVPHVSMLAYKYLLVVLARFFAHYPEPDQRTMTLLRRWFWRAAVVGPEGFKGSTTGAIRALCARIQPGNVTASIKGLLDAVPHRPQSLPDLDNFRSNTASTKVMLCAWWAKGPRSLEDYAPFEQETLAECLTDRQTAIDAVRNIFPRSGVPKDLRGYASNRVLMPKVDTDVIEISTLITQQRLSQDMHAYERALMSHSISPQLADLLVSGKIKEFLMERQILLQHELEHFLGRMCEWDFEDTPSLSKLIFEDED